MKLEEAFPEYIIPEDRPKPYPEILPEILYFPLINNELALVTHPFIAFLLTKQSSGAWQEATGA